MEDDRDVDPWICRRCGKGIEEHDHASGQGKFFCRGTHLNGEFWGQDEEQPPEQPTVEQRTSLCPFCGDPGWRSEIDLTTRAMQIECRHCGARSPRCKSEEEALAAWR